MEAAPLPKKFINEPSEVVGDMLDGLCAMNADVARLRPYNVIAQRRCLQAPLSHVAVISGGGSGHEPMAGGFVGKGLLAAAVAGGVFASPNTDSVLAAITACASKAHGALLVVLQYTGDRLCFGAAAAIARSRGYPVHVVLVGDDCALPADDSHAGRRGLSGITFVLKIAGALAESGASLNEVYMAATTAASWVRTYGVAASACTVPGSRPPFSLGADEIELGLGIHGERGVKRGPMEPVKALVTKMLATALAELRLPGVSYPYRLALAVNGLGGTPAMELLVIARDALQVLAAEATVEVMVCGNLVTSLEMSGFSLSVMPLQFAWRDLLLARCEAPYWPHCFARPSLSNLLIAPTDLGAHLSVLNLQTSLPPSAPASPQPTVPPAGPEVPRLRRCVAAVCGTLLAKKDLLTELDQVVGDGDLGISLSAAATSLLAAIDTLPLHSVSATIEAASDLIRASIGGTSGPLYTVALIAAARAERINHGLVAWDKALEAAVEAIAALGGAKRGDRTMLDALIPATVELDKCVAENVPISAAIARAAEAARDGAEQTAQMAPRKGRSSYLGSRAIGHRDPGAVAIALQLEALAEAMR